MEVFNMRTRRATLGHIGKEVSPLSGGREQTATGWHPLPKRAERNGSVRKVGDGPGPQRSFKAASEAIEAAELLPRAPWGAC